MSFDGFFARFGCLTFIIVFVAIIFAFQKIDGLYYISHDPVDYCRKFPDGKYEDKALTKVIRKLDNGDYYYRKFGGKQKRLAAFCQEHTSSACYPQLSQSNEKYFKLIKDYCGRLVLPESFDYYDDEDRVEERLLLEIRKMRTSLENGWQNEQLAWSYVCKVVEDEQSFDHFHLDDVFHRYLSYHPRGVHAINVYELLDALPEDDDY